MRPLLAAIALSLLAACAPRVKTYGECMKDAEARIGDDFRSARTVAGMGHMNILPKYRASAEAWAACCDLSGVPSEDEPNCARARQAARHWAQ